MSVTSLVAFPFLRAQTSPQVELEFFRSIEQFYLELIPVIKSKSAGRKPTASNAVAAAATQL